MAKQLPMPQRPSLANLISKPSSLSMISLESVPPVPCQSFSRGDFLPSLASSQIASSSNCLQRKLFWILWILLICLFGSDFLNSSATAIYSVQWVAWSRSYLVVLDLFSNINFNFSTQVTGYLSSASFRKRPFKSIVAGIVSFPEI